MLNLGNWVVATCRIQQGNLEAATLSILSKIGVKLGCCDMSCPTGESGDCSTFNAQQGSWGVATCHIQQGSLGAGLVWRRLSVLVGITNCHGIRSVV